MVRMIAQTPSRAPLQGERFHVIVIGGGINGVAIARECARRGRRTLLVEQNDFGAGTTSRSTRIIHGGLRYLEHGELGLVRDSLRERQRLLRTCPHLMHPLQFLLTLDQHSRRSALAIRAGLWLYRRMGGAMRLNHSSGTDQGKLERLLDRGRRWSIFAFEDAQCEFPERLVAEWLLDAVEAGAVVRNHTQVLAIDVFHGRAKGVLLRDGFSGKEQHVEGTWIVNATGPWADRICQRSRILLRQPMIGGVRGSHIVLPRFAGAPDAAVYTEAEDGRPIFVIPWNEQVLVGSTEIPDQGDPAKTRPSGDEIHYLLSSFQRLFPSVRFSPGDVRYSFAGLRPLPFSRDRNPSSISRKHILREHADDGASNLISVIGGKLTTGAQLARECADKVAGPRQGDSSLAVYETDLGGALDNWVLQIAEIAGIGEISARSMVEWHGKRSLDIARMSASSADMRAPLCPHSEHVVAEAVHAFHHEFALTLADVLLRRVPVALGACWSDACSREAAGRIAAALRWSEYRAAEELESFEMERAAFLRKPTGAPLEAAAD